MDGKLFVSADKVDWIEAGKDFKYATLFKLASGRAMNKERFEEVMSAIWKLDAATSFFKVEKYILLVNFQSERDQHKVIDGGPWSFDNSALLMQRWGGFLITPN